jgi:hypothetical protein
VDLDQLKQKRIQAWIRTSCKKKIVVVEDVETLTTRTNKSSEVVPVEYLQNIIQYYVNQFYNCQAAL